ncbi:MAG: polysaccharide biosynthesis/export family protein [Pirellulales bacterium]|nr:polysaccharide biosynthesis/export family protein [Pirellulales bacterium]
MSGRESFPHHGWRAALTFACCAAAALAAVVFPPAQGPAGESGSASAGVQVDRRRQAKPRSSEQPLPAAPAHGQGPNKPGQREVPRPSAARALNRTSQCKTSVGDIQLCQALGPAAPCPVQGIDCAACGCSPRGWDAMSAIPWQVYGQGEYVGHDRLPHVPEYRLRVDDQLELVFRVTREELSEPYQLNVGDELRIESAVAEPLKRDVVIQPDGMISLPLVGQVKATRRSVEQLRQELEELYEQYFRVPGITVTPLKVNSKLEDLRATVDSRQGFGGQSRRAVVTPEGTIGLPGLGSVPAQGLTLEELKLEIDARYAQQIQGIEVTPILLERAPRFIYVVGEVKTPGRYRLEGPTTVMQAISLGGGWNVGANLRQVVVFRRGDDWRLLATMLDLRGALYGKRPCPCDEIWLNDADIVVVPKSPILVLDNFIELVFTKGIYGVLPFQTFYSFNSFSTVAGS